MVCMAERLAVVRFHGKRAIYDVDGLCAALQRGGGGQRAGTLSSRSRPRACTRSPAESRRAPFRGCLQGRVLTILYGPTAAGCPDTVS